MGVSPNGSCPCNLGSCPPSNTPHNMPAHHAAMKGRCWSVCHDSDGPLGAAETILVLDHGQPSCLTVVGLPLAVLVSTAGEERTASTGAVRRVACSLLYSRLPSTDCLHSVSQGLSP